MRERLLTAHCGLPLHTGQALTAASIRRSEVALLSWVESHYHLSSPRSQVPASRVGSAHSARVFCTAGAHKPQPNRFDCPNVTTARSIRNTPILVRYPTWSKNSNINIVDASMLSGSTNSPLTNKFSFINSILFL